MLLFVTDGTDTSGTGSDRRVREAAKNAAAHGHGIKVLAVGIGDGIDYNQLKVIAGSAHRVRTVKDFKSLSLLTSWICQMAFGIYTYSFGT